MYVVLFILEYQLFTFLERNDIITSKGVVTMFSESEYNKIVINRIQYIMKSKSLTQSELAQKSNIGQSTLSKLLTGETKITLQHIYKISTALDIDPCIILSFSEEKISETKNKDNFSSGIFKDDFFNTELFITNPEHAAFNGYIDTELHLYVYPTISSETGLLHGILSLKKSEDKKHCNAVFTLFTGKTTQNGTPSKKIYNGELMISMTMSVCYIFLVNEKIGEMCFLSFKHLYLFNQELVCRVATISSTSSGGNKLPIMQRALISKYELNISNENSDDLEFIMGQLRLNNSEIIISKKKYEKHRKMLAEKKAYDNDLIDFFAECEEYSTTEAYIIIDENKIRSIDTDPKIKSHGISVLRNISIAPKYNKIGSKSDEFTFHYLDSSNTVK